MPMTEVVRRRRRRTELLRVKPRATTAPLRGEGRGSQERECHWGGYEPCTAPFGRRPLSAQPESETPNATKMVNPSTVLDELAPSLSAMPAPSGIESPTKSARFGIVRRTETTSGEGPRGSGYGESGRASSDHVDFGMRCRVWRRRTCFGSNPKRAQSDRP
jgi:hypothetical protein